ncbi:hypothetical protein DPX16_1301 [Anabarilius grahami]|uniref:Uncharacterized protein n=1 Tax=Anabarilius grahami TaxID=495550 RepID=A0A3N0Y7C4_ANAGA|nr:hypothetical protein DPX16_1301 [Anabarilius grahami]
MKKDAVCAQIVAHLQQQCVTLRRLVLEYLKSYKNTSGEDIHRESHMSDEMHVVSSVPSQELEQNVTDWLVPSERQTDRDRQTDRQIIAEGLESAGPEAVHPALIRLYREFEFRSSSSHRTEPADSFHADPARARTADALTLLWLPSTETHKGNIYQTRASFQRTEPDLQHHAVGWSCWCTAGSDAHRLRCQVACVSTESLSAGVRPAGRNIQSHSRWLRRPPRSHRPEERSAPNSAGEPSRAECKSFEYSVHVNMHLL